MYNTALKILNELARQQMKQTHPNVPYPFAGTFKDKTSNQLTQSIIKFLQLKGHQAERIATTGRTIDQRLTYTDILGNTRQIGRVKYIKSSMQRGSSDISTIIRTMSGIVIPWKIEVKIKDYQSEDQKRYEEAVKKAGGHYSICRSFQDFYDQYNQLIND